MSILDSLLDFGRGAAEVYGTVEGIKKQPRNGVATVGARPEYVPDQTSVGVPHPTGMGNSVPASGISVAGITMDKNVLLITGGVLATLLVLKVAS